MTPMTPALRMISLALLSLDAHPLTLDLLCLMAEWPCLPLCVSSDSLKSSSFLESLSESYNHTYSWGVFHLLNDIDLLHLLIDLIIGISLPFQNYRLLKAWDWVSFIYIQAHCCQLLKEQSNHSNVGYPFETEVGIDINGSQFYLLQLNIEWL